MRHTTAVVASLMVVGLLTAQVLFAQPPRLDGPGPMPFGGALRALDLTVEQRTAAREILKTQLPERESLHLEMQENQAALDEALQTAQPDPLLVGELVIAREALRERGRTLHEESKKALEGLLTNEQKLKLEVLESMRGPGPGPGIGRRGPVPEWRRHPPAE